MIQAVSAGSIPDGLFQRFLPDLRKDRQMKTTCVTVFFSEALTIISAATIDGGVLRHGERRRRCRCASGLYPGRAVGLELGNDVGGDFIVEARPASTCGHARLLEAPGRQCNAFADRIDPDVLAAHTPMASLSFGLSLARQAFGGSTCRINQPSSLHMAFGPMDHVTARSFRCSWPMAFR